MPAQPSLPPVPNRDLLLRLSYTQQAAAFLHLAQLAHDSQPSGSGEGCKGKGKGKGKERAVAAAADTEGNKKKRGGGRKARRQQQDGAPGSLARLARSLVGDIPRVASHSKIRLDPNFKRSFCKTCNSMLLPGLTAKVSTRPSRTHGHVVASTCTRCSTTKVLPRPPLYPLPFPADTLLAPDPPKRKGRKKPRPLANQAAAVAAAAAAAAAAVHVPQVPVPFAPLAANGAPAAPAAPAPALQAPPPANPSEQPAEGATLSALAHDEGDQLPPAADAPAASAHPSLPAPPPPAPAAAPELRYNRRELRQMRVLARRATVTPEQRAAKERFKHGKRRPDGAEAGYGTGGGREILSEREGVGHWRTDGKGWKEV